MLEFKFVQAMGFQRTAVAIALAAAGAIAAVWGLTLERTRYERQGAIERAQVRTEHLALAYEQDILRTMQVVDQMVRYVRHQYTLEGTRFDLKKAFGEGWVNGDLFAYAAVIDANGSVVLGSSNPRPFDVSDRDYFGFHRDRPQDILHVGVQTASRVDGRPSVHFSRRIDTLSGQFAGVAMVAVPPALLADVHRRLDIGTQGLVALIGLDGVAPIRRVGDEIKFGVDYRAGSLLQRARSEPHGSYVSPGRIDGVERFVSYRTLSGYPFVAVVGVSVNDALAEAQAHARSHSLIAAGATLLIVLVGAALLVAVQRQRAAAEEKRRSEALYRATFDHAAVGMAHADPSGRFLRVNPKLCEMLGYAEEELLRLSWLQVTHPDDAERASRLVTRMLADPGARLPEIEKRYRCKDGTERWGLASVALVRDAGGRPEYFVSVLKDITDRKRAESTAEESELRFRQLAENIREVFWLTDPSKNEMLYVSPAYEQIWGRSPETLYASPRDWIEAIHVEDRARVLLAAQKQAADEYDEEYRILRPDGSVRWIRDRAFPVLRDGRVYRVAGIAEDITDRKRTADELRESERRFRDMLGNVALIAMTLDREARITYCNDYLLRLTGWRREELIGKNWFDVFIPADINGSMKGVFAGLLDNLPSYWHYENEIVTRAGERRLIHWNNSVLRSASGEVIGTASIGEDISERKRAEQAAVRLARMFGALSATNDAILHARSPEELYQRVCDATVHGGKFPNTTVLLAEPGKDRMKAVASAGRVPQRLTESYISIDESIPQGRGLVGTAYRTQRACISNDFLNDERTQPWHEIGREGNCLAAAALPLIQGGRSVGAVLIHYDELNAFDEEITKLLERMAENVSFALDNFEREAERRRIEHALRESEARFRSLTSLSSDVYWEQDAEFRFTSFTESRPGQPAEEKTALLGKRRWEVGYLNMTPEDWAKHRALLEARQPFHDLELCRIENGARVWISTSGEPLFDAGGVFKGYRGIGKDITESKRALEAIQRAEARYRATFDQAGVGIVHATLEGRFMRANRKICDMLGYEEAELLGRGFDAVTHPEDRKLTADLAAALRDGPDATPMPEYEKRYVCKDGRMVWGAVSLSLVRDAQGRPEYFIALVKDVTARKEAEEKLIYRAHYDPLTDLPNRTLFYDRLAQVLNQARRHDRTFGVMVIDLDRFKSVNDTLGHSHGDRLLQDVAKRLSQCLRSGDTVARVGGDEFAIVAADLTHAQDAAILAQKVLASLAKPFDLDGHEVFIGASVGIATFPVDGGEAGVLIQNADAAMFRAKELGRNNYQFYTAAMNERAMENMLLENDLRRALERREFRLHFQPKARLRDGCVAGLEALLRWERPGKGLVSPAQFVPLLENTGLIVPVGEWVIRAAFAQLREWQQEGREPLPVAVNLAAKQFVHHDIVAVVDAAARESGVPAELLEVEITESDAMKNPERTLAVLQRLEARGVRIAIDDFGTGYSSLSYLKRFPVHTLKLDRSFVKGLPDDTEDASIALAVVTMAHSLGLEVVAEGVETAAQQRFLAEHGCDQMQGYLLSRPLPAAECARFFDARRRALAA